MRYRHLSYRHALIVTTDPTRLLRAAWRALRVDVILTQPRWRPDADVFEGPTALLVTIDLAGVAEEAIDVTLFEDALMVEGERRIACASDEGFYHTAAIRQGPFRLEVPLPAAIDPEGVAAELAAGLLRITLPKLEGRRERGVPKPIAGRA